MKWCHLGSHEVEPTEFYRHPTHPDGLSSSCKDCTKAKARQRRKDGLEVKKPRTKKYKQVWTPELRARKAERDRKQGFKARLVRHRMIVEFLLTHPCVDCDETDPLVLEFDHVDGTKHRAISDMIARCEPVERIQAEMEKCEVRCANCHKRITSIRGEHIRFIVLAELGH